MNINIDRGRNKSERVCGGLVKNSPRRVSEQLVLIALLKSNREAEICAYKTFE